MDRKRQKLNPEKVSVGSPGTMADSCCIAELKETIEKMNAELIQSHTKISELNAKVREQEEGQKEMSNLREENAQLARALKESEEKCRAVQERLELAEQRLAQFSQKADATAEESLAQVQDGQGSVGDRIQKLEQLLREKETELIRSEERCRAVQESLDLAEQKLAQFSETPVTTAEELLAQVNESNDDALGINSLPDEIIAGVFGYLTQNQLGQIARVCRRWNVLTKSPVLWRKVNVKISSSVIKKNIVAKSFINGLPSCVTSIRLAFSECRGSIAVDFEELCLKLHQNCPHVEELILINLEMSNLLPEVINFCTQFLQCVKKLEFHECGFCDCSRTVELNDNSKIEVLDLYSCNFFHFSKKQFSKLLYLKELRLAVTNVDDTWFVGDTSFLNQLHVLDLGWTEITASTFLAIQRHGHNLKELYLCEANLLDNDLTFNNSVFPHLRTICLSAYFVTCESVVSLIQSCPSLQNVYVSERVAESFAAHPFVVANRCKSGIVKAIYCIHDHDVDYSHN